MGAAVCVGKPKASPETRLTTQTFVSTNGSQNKDKGEFALDYTTERKD
jgi:hypothetical protein